MTRREPDVPQPPIPRGAGSEAILDFGLGVRVRVTQHAEPRAQPSDLIHEAAEHFYGCLLRGAKDAAERDGPETPGPLDTIDPYFLTVKAATFAIVRALLRGQCITHDRVDRESPGAAAAVLLAAWAPLPAPVRSPVGPGPALVPLGFVTLVPAGVVQRAVLYSLPLPWAAPGDWTRPQRDAVDALVRAVGPVYEAWNQEVFLPAQRLAHQVPIPMAVQWPPRLRTVADAWADWWRLQIGPWWEANAVGSALARGFEGVAKSIPRLARAWRRALKNHGFDADAAARDVADARVGAGDSVWLTEDGRAVFNFRGALEAEANRQAREARRRRHEVPQTDLQAAGVEALPVEEPTEEREYVGDARDVIRAAALAVRMSLRRRFRDLGAAPVKAIHHRVARRLAWTLWRGASIARVAARTGANRPNLTTAWKAWRKVLEADPEVQQLVALARSYSDLG